MERSCLIGWIGNQAKHRWEVLITGLNMLAGRYSGRSISGYTSLYCGLSYYSKSVGTTRPESEFLIVKIV